MYSDDCVRDGRDDNRERMNYKVKRRQCSGRKETAKKEQLK